MNHFRSLRHELGCVIVKLGLFLTESIAKGALMQKKWKINEWIMHVGNSSFLMSWPLLRSILQAPGLSEMAVHLNNSNCNSVKTPVALNIIHDSLVQCSSLFLFRKLSASLYLKGFRVCTCNFSTQLEGKLSGLQAIHSLLWDPGQWCAWKDAVLELGSLGRILGLCVSLACYLSLGRSSEDIS